MIIVECEKDQALMFRLSFTPDQIIHAFHKSDVLGRMESRRKSGQKAIGVIDEDPQAGQPACLKEYEEKDSVGSIKLLIRKDDDGKSVICRAIQISPYLEDWLCEIARRCKVPLNKFGLPDRPAKLHGMSLKFEKNNKNMQNFQRFLDALREKKDDEINTLRKWIREAIE